MAPVGTFQVEIITGYGTVKEQMIVNVHDQEIELPGVMEEIPEVEDKKAPISMKPALIVLCLVLAWASFAAGFAWPGAVPGVVPMLILTAGVAVGWFFRSS